MSDLTMYRSSVYDAKPAPAPTVTITATESDLRVPTDVYLLVLHAKTALVNEQHDEADRLLELALRRSEA